MATAQPARPNGPRPGPQLRPGSTVCIIGGGPVGVYATRQCMDSGLVPTLYEATGGLGGAWRHTEVPAAPAAPVAPSSATSSAHAPTARMVSDLASVHGSAYDSLYTNSSRWLVAASDYPFPFKPSNFPFHHELVRYVESYAEEFGLAPHVRLNTAVVSCVPVPRADPESGVDGAERTRFCRWKVGTIRWGDAGTSGAGAGSSSSRSSSSGGGGSDGGVDYATFDAVFVATGQFWHAKYPEGLEPGGALRAKFGGEVLHAHQYRRPGALAHKRVLCIGSGNSAWDISLEVATAQRDVPEDGRRRSTPAAPCPAPRAAAAVEPTSRPPCVVVSCRTPTTVLPVIDGNGDPMDVRLLSRFFNYGLPNSLRGLRFMLHLKGTNDFFKRHGMPIPKSMGHPATPVGNLKQVHEYRAVLESSVPEGGLAADADDLCGQGKAGQVRLRPAIKELSHRCVTFADGSVMKHVDAIVCCTGYDLAFPFLDDSVRDAVMRHTPLLNEPGREGDPRTVQWLDCYKRCMHPENQTLFVLGVVNSLGYEASVGELQAQWAVAMLTGEAEAPWPSPQVIADASRKRAETVSRGLRMPGFVRYVHYCDELAKDIGCSASVASEIAAHPLWPRLWLSMAFGPAVPAQWRLRGPHAWKGAAEYLASVVPLAKL